MTFGASPKVVNELLNIKEERKDGILILTKMGHLVALVWQSYHDCEYKHLPQLHS